ncbi:MAG: 5-oxoprolinase subunit PxpB [Clostridia bacterium]|nr:5-oxoprolinase subunit PxpB [Clostridia bacterium]
MKKDYRILPCGDSAVTVQFGDVISPEINARVASAAARLADMRLDGIEDIIPTYRSFTVCYDPCAIDSGALLHALRKACKAKKDMNSGKKTVFYIPVAYGSEFGPDLHNVAAHAGITPLEVVRRHATREYMIYMLGFLPGFPYLSGMDPSLETPRLENPRTAIPVGAVGIGGKQTGIYPIASPGGWNLIGRTPVRPYDPQQAPPVIYKAGDIIRFVPITRAEYTRIAAEVKNGAYKIKTEAR